MKTALKTFSAWLSNWLPLPATSGRAQAQTAPSWLERPARLGVLFLDFDGVLHVGNSGTFALLPDLEALLRRYPDVDVVVSSAWRTAELAYLRTLFSPDIAPRVIGTTPDLEAQGLKREHEIRQVLFRHGIARWVALGGKPEAFPIYRHQLVATDFKMGITAANLEELARHFEDWLDDAGGKKLDTSTAAARP